jgi:4'-phosphopantetheinyl transferase
MSEPWQTVTILPTLAPGEVHVWRITLPAAQTDPEPYTRTLAPEEVSRAARLRAGHVRLQFVIARAALRVLLGNLLSLDTSQVPIEIGAHGKPEVSGHDLHFNLAHTANVVLIAITRDCAVGIDVERISREVEALDIARSSFSSNEIRDLESIAGADQLQRAFFHCWTRKEAVIKADGRGLSLPLAAFDVPVSEQASATPVRIPGPAGIPSTATTFYLSDLPCGEDLAAAVALGSPEIDLHLLDLPLELIRLPH